MRTNQRMRNLLADADLTGLSSSDIPPMFREVVERGWSVTGSGARVLTDLRPDPAGSYYDRLAEETTVNGRGMTDYDLPADLGGGERANVLLRRCLAYADACLRAARDHFGDDVVRAYVSLSPGGLDDGLLTTPGHVLHTSGGHPALHRRSRTGAGCRGGGALCSRLLGPEGVTAPVRRSASDGVEHHLGDLLGVVGHR
ncbi:MULTISPECIES: hypothetical protein [Streptomyces]|uniref:hypothetical protein n=1 Tax=Streptomyces TaxID=1883 RepID=UPI0019CE7012|nr:MULTISPECIES: hypothetical protein [Streptomyces]GGT24181.1 hypothetical protein GCM10010286_57090 [Streptomyces toxytricini]